MSIHPMAKDTGVLDILINTTHRHVWLRKYESLGFGWGKGLFPFSTLQTYYTTYMGICQPPIRYFFYLINN